MKILITGASGFVGRHVGMRLTSADFETVSFGRTDPKISGLRHVLGVVADSGEVFGFLRSFAPDVVVHLAANCDRGRDASIVREAIGSNVIPVATLVDYAAACSKPIKIISLGTAEEYGAQAAPFSEKMSLNPISPYGWSKSCASTLLQMAGDLWQVNSFNLRTSIAYGPQQRETMFIPYMISSLLKKIAPDMTPGEQLRDFVYVEDVVDAIFRCLDVNLPGYNLFNIASGESVSLKRVANQLATIIGNGVTPKFGAIPYRQGEIMDYRCDRSLAALKLNWAPKISLNDGLRLTVESMKA